MSAAAAAAAPPAQAADADAAPPAKKGKKKLIIIIAAAAVLLLAIGGGVAVYLKKKAAHEAELAEENASGEPRLVKPDLKHPPTFLPLDPFVVNLSDADTDRYAQVGITLEVEDAHYGEEMKAFMPAIRNGILMILSHKTSAELKDRPGKEILAAEILREVSHTMGIEVEAPEAHAATATAEKAKDEEPAKEAESDDDAKPKKKATPKEKPKAEPNPIKHVHFSNFIVQ